MNSEPLIKAESLSMRNGIYDSQRSGTFVSISPDRRLAAFTDSLGRVSVLDISKGYIIRLFKGCRDAQCAFIQVQFFCNIIISFFFTINVSSV